MERQKRLLILIDWFTPGFKAGGPIQSCVNICYSLNKLFDIYVFTTDTDHGELIPYDNITSNQWSYNEQLGVKIFYAKKKGLTCALLTRQIKFVNADIIYLNHLFSPYFVIYPLALKFLNLVKAKFIVCPRGALYSSALDIKRHKKIPLLYMFKWMGINRRVNFHATNDRELKAIEQYFPGSNILIADNLPDLRQPPLVNCKKEIGILRCIFIARIVPIKNLLFLLKILQGIEEQIILSIAGPIEDQVYWQDCEHFVKKMHRNITVDYLGALKRNELIPAIQRHHLFVLPTLGENFGHSIFEALLSGRPVLISDQTPWHNLESLEIGWDISLKDPEKFVTIIKKVAHFDQHHFNKLAENAWQYAKRFINNTDSHLEYINLFK